MLRQIIWNLNDSNRSHVAILRQEHRCTRVANVPIGIADGDLRCVAVTGQIDTGTGGIKRVIYSNQSGLTDLIFWTSNSDGCSKIKRSSDIGFIGKVVVDFEFVQRDTKWREVVWIKKGSWRKGIKACEVIYKGVAFG